MAEPPNLSAVPPFRATAIRRTAFSLRLAPTMRFQETGRPRAEIEAELARYRDRDADWRAGRTFSLVYHAGEEHEALLKSAYGAYFSENALNPMAFPSLRRFESEVLGAVAELFHGSPDAAGSMTSGGTESILMAVKAARVWARAERPDVRAPEMIIPATVHPAFE